MRTHLKSLIDRNSYFEWAYGYLAESDSDIGPIAEFLIGTYLGCLHKHRSVNAPYDLTLPDGRTIEVKATTKRTAQSRTRPSIYRWDVGTQLKNHTQPIRQSDNSPIRQSDNPTIRQSDNSSSLPIASLWFFLIASFPPSAPTTRHFDVFDPRYWTVYPVPGPLLASTGIKQYVTETTLKRLKISPVSLPDLKRFVTEMCHNEV